MPLEEDGTLSLLQYGNKQIYLIGTAHISAKSADQVRKVIHDVKPDTVFVELCPTRAEKMWAKIYENEGKEQKDLAPITSEEWLEELPHAKQMKEMQGRMLKFLEGFGFVYGGEFLAALEESKNVNAQLVYGDRDVRETMKRMNDGFAAIWEGMSGSVGKTWNQAWNQGRENLKKTLTDGNNSKDQWYNKSDDGKTESFGKREDDWWSRWFSGGQQTGGSSSNSKYDKYANMGLFEGINAAWEESKKQRVGMGSLGGSMKELWGLFTNPEETIEAMKDRNKIREKFADIKKFAPELIKGLVEERDEIMAENLKKCKGKVIVAVVGIGHMDGIEERFKNV